MCNDCHGARNVTTSAQGSHPVGVSIPGGSYKSPATLPLDKTTTEVRCMSCHKLHYTSPVVDGSLGRLANVTSLCSDCHTLADTTTPASHLSPSTGVLWPGPQYGTLFPRIADTTKRGFCTNCHQTHGWPDGAKPGQDYPALLVNQEESLCYACHDGSPAATNVLMQFTKSYRHPAPDYSGRHSVTEDGDSARYGTTNRHAECEDCHNSHLAGADTTAPIAEYQICFKCHSSWTTQPSGQSDTAAQFNSNNRSYHPIEAQGKSPNINPNAFVNGWTASSSTYCSDCHSSDDVTVSGPHGSQYQYLLKQSSIAGSARRTTVSTELCFSCHSFNTYANEGATVTQKSYSRFNLPATDEGHTKHVGDHQYPCYACHGSHGSATQPYLIVTGRNPGLNSYTQTASGGTCSPTCHGTKSYQINYAR